MRKLPLSRAVLTSALAVALLPVTASAQSAGGEQKRQSAAPPAQSSSSRQAARTDAKAKVHKLAIQVDENRPDLMNLALNNAKNVLEYYKLKGEAVAIEIVAFGPGLHMLRDDTSPVKQRIAEMALAEPSVTFVACANTQANQSRQEQKPITLISEAKLMPSGVVRLMELQKQGYAYIRP